MIVYGMLTATIQLGDKIIQHPVKVTNCADDGILGTDFLRRQGVILNFKDNTTTCGGETLKTHCKAVTNRVCRVIAAETVTIPAGTRSIVEGKVPQPLADGPWIVEPLSQPAKDRSTLTARAVVTSQGSRVPVEIMNPGDTDVILYKNTHVALASPVERSHVMEIPESPPVEQTTDVDQHSTLPPDLQKLIDDIEIPLSSEVKDQTAKLLQHNRNTFSLPGEPLGRTTLVQHGIDTGDATPIKQPVRRPPFHMRSAAEKEVTDMLEKDVIEPSNSPWASPVVLVKKKDGSLRYCIDYRRLNAVTRKDSYPLPRIDDSLDSLGQAKYFSTLDLASGYWQIGLTEEAREKSAFCTTSGLFQFKVMPFGLTNAPATFQRLMERILAGLQWQICLVYIDDIIIFSRSAEEHLQQLQTVLSRLQAAGLKLKPKKCKLFRRKVSFLGHLVSEAGIETDPEKVAAVQKWPRPSTVTDVRSFLGFCSYYRRFIPEFASISKPLVRLTEKSVPFLWSDREEDAWLELKKRLTTAPILGYPHPDRTFVLDTDASDFGIGAVLSQVVDGREVVIAYGSRVLSKAERRYCVTRRELLAVVHFVKLFRHYLIGREFVLRTDHAPLRWLRSFKSPEGQVARWLEVLDTYHFKLVHRPGKQHLNADAMSRGPCHQCEGPHQGEKIRMRKPQPDRVQAVRTRSSQPQTMDPSASNWLNTQTTNLGDLKTAQLTDPVLSRVYKWVEQHDRPLFENISGEGRETKFYWSQFPNLLLINGVLVRRLEGSQGVIRQQILVPDDMRKTVLHECHEALTAGHLGQRKTLANVRRRFIWPGMREQTELFVKSCDLCGRHKTQGKTRRAALKDYQSGEPLQRLCIDIVGPFPESRCGNKYGLVVTDAFTKFVEIYPMPNQEAETVAKLLAKEFFAKYGVPRELHSDQGTQFESQLFSELCTLLGIHKTRTTPFRPQSDGQSERNIKTLTKMIAMSTTQQQDWDEHLPFLSMAYRATPHETTGLTPNYMMFGREVSMPVDVMFPLPADDQYTPNLYAKKLQDKLSYAYQLARSTLKKNAERQQRLYNRECYGATYHPGDLVWYMNKLRKKGVSPKLQPKWRGPCLVTKMYNDVLAEIALTAKKTIVVHTDLLKPCHSRSPPAWLNRLKKKL